MPRTQAADWWADVQEQRDDLEPSGRNPLEWSDDDFDLIPATVAKSTARAHGFVHVDELAERRPARRFQREDPALDAQDTPNARTITLDPVGAAPSQAAPTAEHAAPAAPARRTVHITGNPDRVPSAAQRHRQLTAGERVGHRPDRIAMWAAVFGFVLLLVAMASSSDASAATLALSL